MTESVAKIELIPPPGRHFKPTEYSKLGLLHLQAYNLMIAEPTEIWTPRNLASRLSTDAMTARRIINSMIIAGMIDRVDQVEGGYQISDTLRQNHRRAIMILEAHSHDATRRANILRGGGA